MLCQSWNLLFLLLKHLKPRRIPKSPIKGDGVVAAALVVNSANDVTCEASLPPRIVPCGLPDDVLLFDLELLRDEQPC